MSFGRIRSVAKGNRDVLRIVEIKRKSTIGREIEDEVESKVKALALPRGVSVRTALIYEGRLSPGVEADGYFDALIPFGKLLGLRDSQ